ncbi:Group 1 truncated hemoglobin GlbN [Planktothrix tepida]|uniref:Group 1 truncated hemoglobin n=2 Tax=Planktothrix TaxID=54304 RepID=A0A1J1LLV4_9CYAN|nr:MULTISPECIES: group 1 truncated hemoglobin [Planktothrix]CAD5935664.1 Group 1 truncated hemoglobin GlbN [Planktothrix tepida]CAD5975902.1 Group 1 truncated hemoglobin GlbN [Planktothrix pseudagardhii]CUR33451.1 Group 1 truncated hemoglobin GlbN [Planktothrix tepida PCC 9214]
MSTLYEKLGGAETVKLAVDNFYDRVLQDNRIKHFFNGMDMVKQKSHQRAFLTYAFGGTPQYDGRAMREAHKHLVEEQGLKGEHFDAIAENLELTLQDFEIAEELIAEVMSVASDPQHRSDVLNQ